jgi:hypothetical protein
VGVNEKEDENRKGKCIGRKKGERERKISGNLTT